MSLDKLLPRQFLLPPMLRRDRVLENLKTFLAALPMERAFVIQVGERKSLRSHAQNSYLWHLYEEIIRRGGEALAGYEKEELHDFFLMLHFGEEVRTVFGRKKVRPRRRSSRLSKTEFADFVDHIMRFMAQQGVVLADPDPNYWQNAA